MKEPSLFQHDSTSSPVATPPKKTRFFLLKAVIALVLALQICHVVVKHTFDIPVVEGQLGVAIWAPCHNGLECGYITVPKDYFNASEGVAQIAVARKRATKLPKKGSVMLNPGGPGGSGVDFLVRLSETLSVIMGSEWDFIGFDPRGVGATIPKVKCFPDQLTQRVFLANTLFEQGITVPNPSNISDPRNFEAFVEQQRQFISLKQAQAALCADNMDANDLRFMGTANVVRDMDYMTKVLHGPDAKINYFGGSYGSILGAYLVNMLPHRIGYATIDGIADPISWANEPSHKWHKGWVAYAEKAYEWFLKDCSEAGPDHCPLTKAEGESPLKIEERIENFIESLVDRPLAVSRGPRPGYITSGAARGLLFIALQVPRSWPIVSRALAEAMPPHANGTIMQSILIPPLSAASGHSGAGDLSRLGVTCADSPPTDSVTAEELAKENLRALREGSIHFGVSPIMTESDGGCQYWPTKGRTPERFTGPWNASLEYPLLIISNTADPITPLASGLLINSHMPNSSTLLIQNSPGHCSLSFPSICTMKATRRYWAGHPPTNGTVCEVDGPIFSSSSAEHAPMMSEDDELWQAANKMGHYLDVTRRPTLATFI